jgi:glutaredoxin
MTVLTLIGKPNCHLCEDARAVVTAVLADFDPASITVEELSILDDPALHERYMDEIPVVLINGQVHNIWRVDATRLRSALKEVAQ